MAFKMERGERVWGVLFYHLCLFRVCILSVYLSVVYLLHERWSGTGFPDLSLWHNERNGAHAVSM